MKAITIWQPWASAIADGFKRIETRSWPTKYRGWLAIHAAKRPAEPHILPCSGAWLPVRSPPSPNAAYALTADGLPLGAIVAVARLVDCVPVDRLDHGALNAERGEGDARWTERALGDYSAGRFGFVLGDLKKLEHPVPCVGRQRLWNLTGWPFLRVWDQVLS